MTRLVRADVFDPNEFAVLHLCARFVRRCFRFGVDPVVGKKHDHQKVWIKDQLKSLAKYLGIDLLGAEKRGHRGRRSFSIILFRKRVASAFIFLPQDLRRKASKRLSRRRLQVEMLENRRMLAFTAIVDNSNTQNFIKTGPWNTYTGIGYGGSVLISVNAGASNATAEWNFNGLAAGNYRVSATWHGGSTAYTTAAPFTMLEGTTQVGSSTLNQRLDPNDFYNQGATWETIGIFSVNASLRVLTNNNSSAGLVVADAVRIEQVFSNSITGIVDNVIDSGYAKSGNWTLTNGVGYGGFYHRSTAPHEGSEWATWTILVDPGAYRVAVTWPQASTTNGSNVQFNVYDSSIYVGGRPINQQVAPDDFFANGTMWESVGTFNIRSKLIMHVSDNANGFAIADAMRIERVSDTVVVDNLSPNFSKTGNWNIQNGSGYADSTYWSNSPHDGSETATWSFSVVPGTTYRIAGTWHEGNPVYGSNLPLQLIENGEVLQTIPISQRTSPNDFFENNYWWEFVTAYKTTSSSLQLKLSDSADGYAIADAFRLERVLSAVPFARDDFYETAFQTDLTVTSTSAAKRLLFNDEGFDSSSPVMNLYSSPTNGVLLSSGPDGSFVYRPNTGFVGIDSLTYSVRNGILDSAVAKVSIAVGTRFRPRENYELNVFNGSEVDPLLVDSMLTPTDSSEGFGMGYSNIPESSSQFTEGGIAQTGGLQLVEDMLPNLSLAYRSDSISKPIVSIDTGLSNNSAVPTQITGKMTFNGVTTPTYSYLTAGLQTGESTRFSFLRDGSTYPTGMYSYTVELTSTVAGVDKTESFMGLRSVVNRTTSPFGTGWNLNGLDRLYNGPSGALLVRGNGDSLWYAGHGSFYLLAPGDTSSSVLTKNANGTFTLKSKTGIVSSFSTLGLLTSRVDANNNAWSYAYADQNGDTVPAELTSVTDPFGRVITFAYSAGKVSSITHFSGRVTTLTYYENQLIGYSLTEPDGIAGPLSSPTVAFGYPANQMSRTNAESETTTYNFNSSHGRLTSVVYADASTWSLAPIETVGLPTGLTGNTIASVAAAKATVTDQRSNAWEFRTDRFGGIVESTTPLGFVRTTLNNANGQPYRLVDVDPDGPGPKLSPVTVIGYNAFLDPTYIVAPDGGITHVGYTSDLHRPLTVIDSVLRMERSKYDVYGNVLAETDGAGFVTGMSYTSRGLITSMTEPDPDGVGPLTSPVTGFGYDAFGRMTSVTNPDNSTQSFTYNSANQMLTQVDELAKTTSFAYDSLGRTVSTTNRVNALTQWTYDAMSRVKKQIDPLGNPIDVLYTNRGWVDKIQYPDPDGVGVLTRAEDIRTYDFVGNLKSQRDPGGNFQGAIPYTYDVDNRVDTRGNSATVGTEYFAYDNLGRMVGVKRATQNQAVPDYNTLDIGYDEAGRVTYRITRDITGSENVYSEYFAYNKAGELISRTDGEGHVSQNAYDDRGLLLQETLPDPDGGGSQFPLIVLHTYDNMGRETRTDRGFDRVTGFEYNKRSWLTKVTRPDPDGAGAATSPITQIAYNFRGDQTGVTDPLMRVTSYAYDDEQRLVSRTDPDPDGTGPLLSPQTSWSYNLNDWLTSSTDPVGAVTGMQYDFLGRLLTQTDPDPDGLGALLSPVTNYAYNMNGFRGVTNAMSGVVVYDRDNRGRVTGLTDSAGLTTEYVYDFYDNLLTQTDPDVDGLGPLKRITTYTYDTRDQLRSKTDPSGTTGFVLDESGNLQTLTDSKGNTTTFHYDGLDRRTKEINDRGFSRTSVYDVAGNLTRTVDRNGKVIQYTFDALDRPTTERWLDYSAGQNSLLLPETTVSTITEGKKTGQQDAVGWTTNANGLSGTFTLSFGGYTTAPIAWNADSVAIQNAFQALPSVGAGNATITTSVPPDFGALGKWIQVTFQNSKVGLSLTRVTINIAGLTPSGAGSTVNPAVTQYAILGQTISEEQRILISGVSAGTWRISYQGETSGPLPYTISALELKLVLDGFVGLDNVSVSTPGSLYGKDIRIVFGGSQAGLDMKTIQADTADMTGGSLVRTISTNYNASDEVVSVVDPSATINFTRDNLGRATTVATTLPGNYGASLTQTFDAVGNRTEMKSTLGATADFKNTYTYDKLRRLTDVVQTSQAGGTPVTPKHVTFSYNALSQRTKIARYQSTGTTSAVATTDFTYDFANRLSGIAHKQGTTDLNTYAFLYDPLSRISTINSTDEALTTYTYDQISQLTGAFTTGRRDENYAYDSNGNRTTTGYTTDTDNRTTASPAGWNAPAYTYTYDNEGNMTSRTSTTTGTTTYQYDHRNRLIVVDPAGGSPIQYSYDAFNRLTRKVHNPTGSTYWVYDEGINPVYEFNGNSSPNLTHRYLWSDYVDELLADEHVTSLASGGNTLWALSDQLGTIRDIADLNEGTGITTAEHRRYEAFGKRTTGSADIIFGYTGKMFDEATGLQNSLNRWYDPNLGRFISQDPIGFGGGDANLYRYVGNSPTNATDPSGLETTSPSLRPLVIAATNSMTDDERLANELARSRECSCQSGSRSSRDPGSMRAMTPDEVLASRWNDLANMRRSLALGFLPVRDHERLAQQFNRLRHELDPYGSAASDINQIGWISLSLAAIGPGPMATVGGARSPKLPFPPAGQSSSSGPRISVFHKGELLNGSVGTHRPLSTGTDRTSVSSLDRGGKVFEFQIPKSKMQQWLREGRVQPFRDFDRKTGVYNEEYRFDSSLAEELNQCIVN